MHRRQVQARALEISATGVYLNRNMYLRSRSLGHQDFFVGLETHATRSWIISDAGLSKRLKVSACCYINIPAVVVLAGRNDDDDDDDSHQIHHHLTSLITSRHT